MNNTYDCNSLDMVGSAKCGLSFAGLHEKSQKSCRPASNSTLQAYHQNPKIRVCLGCVNALACSREGAPPGFLLRST